MGIVICPECNKEVSQYAEGCPTCGFPIKKFMDENKLYDINHVFVCPKCADIYLGNDLELPLHLICKYCGSTVIETREDPHELFKLHIFKSTAKEYAEKSIAIAKEYGDNQFSQDAYEKRLRMIEEEIARNKREHVIQEQQSQQSNQPKCPTCGSTNIEKISVSKKAFGGFLFGVFSSDVRNTMHCKNCGAKW